MAPWSSVVLYKSVGIWQGLFSSLSTDQGLTKGLKISRRLDIVVVKTKRTNRMSRLIRGEEM